MKNKTLFLLMFLTFLFVNVGNTSAQQKHEYVDLGLPSGTLWATCNVGATNPEDYGDYFAWGETTTKTKYNMSNYKYANGAGNKLTKYCDKSSCGNNGYTDSRTTLEKSDDAAYKNWGSDWCMPTQAQFKELINQCTWTLTTLNGKKGYNVKGPNGKSIFLPAAGDRTTSGHGYGHYWMSSLRSSSSIGTGPLEACYLYFDSYRIDPGHMYRTYGCSVRPVRCNATSQSQSQSIVNNATSQSQSQSKGKHEYVDLGLPSGTLWATCNVGAANPWDYGDYFAWGETTIKSTYSWSNYKHGNGRDEDVSKKYNKNDGRTTLELSDDAATANWGSDWCMPTIEQFNELKDKCTWTWTTLNGKNGYNVKGPNGNSIFLPAAGRWESDGATSYVGSYGNYWSSSLSTYYPYDARDLGFHSSGVYTNYGGYRSYGKSVRPVR